MPNSFGQHQLVRSTCHSCTWRSGSVCNRNLLASTITMMPPSSSCWTNATITCSVIKVIVDTLSYPRLVAVS